MKVKMLNKVDIFNESTILLLCYIVWQFTDHNPDPALKLLFGWLYVGVLFGNLAFNVLLLLSLSIIGPVRRKFCPSKKEGTLRIFTLWSCNQDSKVVVDLIK